MKLFRLALLALLTLGQARALSAESALLSGVNALRAQGISCAGAFRPRSAPLIWTASNSAAARLQATYMAQTGRISHTGAGGTSPRVRAASTGVRGPNMSEIIYLEYRPERCASGEVVAQLRAPLLRHDQSGLHQSGPEHRAGRARHGLRDGA